MHWGVLIISLVLLYPCVLAESNVLVLTDDNFKSTIKENPYVMVKFFAPWCGHCKEFAPEYEKAAKQAKEQNKPYILADLDATENNITAAEQKIEGFPTIKFFINGNPIDYNGDRKAEDVLAFLDKKSGPASTKLETKEDIIKVKDGSNLRCILGTKNNELQKIYEDAARTEEDFMFYHTTPEVLKEVFPEAKEDNIVLLKDYDDGKAIYNEKVELTKLKEFLAINSIPIAGEMNLKLIKEVFAPQGRNGIFLFRNPEAANAKNLDEEFKKVATELRSAEKAFSLVDIKSEWGERVAEVFGIAENALPIVEFIEMKGDIVRYRLEEEINAANIKKFIDDCKEGKVKRYMKSEPEPEDNNGPIFKVVGSTFQKEVLDNDNDVMVMFYAPWCGHCKKFEPIYEELAKSLSGNKKLRLMKIDGTANDVEGHSIEGFPTIKFFPGKDKSNVILYEGGRTEAEVAEFIKKHSSNPVEIPEFKSKDEEDLGKEDL